MTPGDYIQSVKPKQRNVIGMPDWYTTVIDIDKEDLKGLSLRKKRLSDYIDGNKASRRRASLCSLNDFLGVQ